MQPLEQLLSPITANIYTVISETISEKDAIIMDKIRKQKVDVLEKGIDPCEANLVRPEIVSSWVRSFKNGLDPKRFEFPPTMDQDTFEKRLQEKSAFIQVATPYLHQMENMLSSAESYIILTDELGVILCVAQALGKNKFHLIPGTIWNEETIGTSSHGMCILLRSPIQLCGPEHFNKIFDNISCSSAPVYDANGNLEGTLTISSPYVHGQSSHTLALVVTMALAIQKDFQLLEKNELFNATIAGTNDAMLVIKQSGLITAANATAYALLEPPGKDLIGSDIEEILGHQPCIESVFETGEPMLNLEILIKKRGRMLQLYSAVPINNKGCILTLRETSQTIKTVKSSPNGSVTRFTFDQIVGSSQQTINTINLARKFARFDNNILIQGESGTGKEVYAQAIHNESRPNGPFIALNCAAIPNNLIESELFGYEAGAFTGAERQGKPGKIELATGGTLFLDEIGDMPIDLQAVLLRVIEDKMITRVGGSRYIPVDFKLITATNKNLLEQIQKNQFREDLYYRISVFNIMIPPLRDRGSEIIQLAEHFVNTIAREHGLPKPVISSTAKYILLQYNWPGNVRQLQNVMLYAVCMCSEGVIRPDCLPAEIMNACTTISPDLEQKQVELITDNTSADSNLSMKDIEKMVIKKALEDSNNHIREAAKILGLSKSTLYRKIKEYELI